MKIVITLTKQYEIDLDDEENKQELLDLLVDEVGHGACANASDIEEAFKARIEADLQEGVSDLVNFDTITVEDFSVAVPSGYTFEVPEDEDEEEDDEDDSDAEHEDSEGGSKETKVP